LKKGAGIATSGSSAPASPSRQRPRKYDIAIVVIAEDHHGDVMFGMQVSAFKRCVEKWNLELEGVRIKLEIVSKSNQPYKEFSKGIALNEGVRRCLDDSKIIVQTDIDILIPPAAIRRAFEWHKANPGKLMIQLSRELFHWDGELDLNEEMEWANPIYARYQTRWNCVGSWMSMEPDQWRLSGGLSEEYQGWGSEDHELKERALLHGIESETFEGGLMHLAHPDRGHKDPQLTAQNHQKRLDEARVVRNFLGYSKPPDFIIAGAQKCGTTALAFMMNKRPEVYLPKMSPNTFEVHHFDNDESYARGDDFYFSWFPTRLPISYGTPAFFGDKTPNYLGSVEIVERMARSVPDAKIIVSLRDPVARAYSALNHAKMCRPKWPGLEILRGNRIDNEFHRQLLECREDNPIFDFGLYYEPVKRLIELYGDNALVMPFSDLEEDLLDVVNRGLRFIGAGEMDEVTDRKINSHAYAHPMRPDDEAALEELYAESNAAVLELLGWSSF